MAYTTPVTLRVEAEMAVHMPYQLPPLYPVAHDEMERKLNAVLGRLPTGINAQLALSPDPVSRYEYGDDFFRVSVTDMPEPSTVQYPWDVATYLRPLLQRLETIRKAFADIGLEADISVYVPWGHNQQYPGWFGSSIKQHEPEVGFHHLPEI